MKTLKQKLEDRGVLSLAGFDETISISEFRKNPGSFFVQVEMGASFKIQRKGKTIAILCPPKLNAFELGAAARSLVMKSSY